MGVQDPLLQGVPPLCWRLRTLLRRPLDRAEEPYPRQASLHSDARRKLDLMSVEVWQVETTCVSVSFPESYSHDATLRPKQFVHDFPLRLWLFPPPPHLRSQGLLPPPPPAASARHSGETAVPVLAGCEGVIQKFPVHTHTATHPWEIHCRSQ